VEDEMAKVELTPEEKRKLNNERMKAYWKTPKGKAYRRVYEKTEKYKASWARKNKKYRATPRGRLAKKAQRARQKLKRLAIAASFGCFHCGTKEVAAIAVSKCSLADNTGDTVICRNCKAKQLPDTVRMPKSRRKGRDARVRKALACIKEAAGCLYCGETDHRTLEFHHRDPKTKITNVSSMLLSREEILSAELAKCEVVCKNCHAIIHAKYRRDPKLDPCCTQNLKN
jgi:hypothetical protein